MNKTICIYCVAFVLLLISCSTAPIQENESSYYLVEALAGSTPTATPFQPGNMIEIGSKTASNFQYPVIGPSATPFPTISSQTNNFQRLEIATQVQPIQNSSEIISVLLLGSDTRSGASFRTDTIIVAIILPSAGQVSLISIPRDLWVNIPEIGMQRINTAYQDGELNGYPGGGAGLLKDTINFNLGINIDFTILVDFDGFRKSIDSIGGIDLPISCQYTDWKLIDNSLDPQNENNWFLYTAGPGILHMDGDLSLWYARSRKHSNDFDRGRRQQEVIRAIYNNILKNNLVSKIPDMYSALINSFSTDIKLDDIVKLVPLSMRLSNPSIRSYFLAGEMVTPWVTPGGANVLIPNNELIQNMIKSAMETSQTKTERIKTWIEIQNGTQQEGLDKLAAERLNYAGFSTTFEPSDNTEHQTTLLYDLSVEQNIEESTGILTLLGLQRSALISAPSISSKTRYALIVGSDYSPCFTPSEITP